MTTRTHSRLNLPPHSYRTPSKTRFFDAFDARPSGQAIITFCKENKDCTWCPSQPTASRWLKEREELDSDETPGRRKSAARRGRKKRSLQPILEVMASGPQPLRKNDWQYFQQQAGVSRRTLKRRMNERDPPIIRSRRRQTEAISAINKQLRIDYGH